MAKVRSRWKQRLPGMRWIILSAGQERSKKSGITTAQITAKGGEDIREELFLAFSHADVPMLTLNQSKTTLEEIFLELTQGSGNRMIKEEK